VLAQSASVPERGVRQRLMSARFLFGVHRMIYRIKDWEKHFENNRTKEMKKMSWVPIPVKLSGDGYTLIMDEKDGPAIFGTWIAFVEVGATCEPRGTFVRDSGLPHDAKSLARITRIPVKGMQRMLDFCTQNCKWVEITDLQGNLINPQEGAGIPQEPIALGNSREGKERKEQNAAYRPQSELLKKRILETKQQKITDIHLENWDNEVRLMVEQDKRTIGDIDLIINECHDMEPSPTGFTWRDQIRSMSKLREKWNEGKIYIGMTKKQSKTQLSRGKASHYTEPTA
jgi:hypothetical protein